MSDQQLHCKKIRDHYQEFLDRELEKALLKRIKQHLENCEECQVRIKVARRFRTVIRTRVKKQARSRRVPDRLRKKIRSELF